jgi:hypothetical protein
MGSQTYGKLPKKEFLQTETLPGQLGKVFFRMVRSFFLIWLILAISGCNNELADKLQSGQVMNMFGLQGRWAGSVTPDADGCGQTTTGLMTIAGNTFAFDPFQGTTVINGTVSDSGLQGSKSRPGNGQQVVSISFSGTAKAQDGAEETIEGRMESGHCSWTVSLKRA